MLSYFKYIRLIMLYNHIATIFIFIIVVISICNTVYCKRMIMTKHLSICNCISNDRLDHFHPALNL